MSDVHRRGPPRREPGVVRRGLDALHDVPLELTVELGRVELPLGELAAQLVPGAVLALDRPAGAALEVRVNSRLIARAEAVAIGERCGIRILELVEHDGRGR
jgi:flagellar motor switch protein FliN